MFAKARILSASVGIVALATSTSALAGPITQSAAFDFALAEETVTRTGAADPSFYVRGTSAPLSFDQYSGTGSLLGVTLSLNSALWHRTAVTATATNTSSGFQTAVLWTSPINTDLNVGLNLPSATSLLTASDRNTVECSNTVSTVLPGSSVECSSGEGHYKGTETVTIDTFSGSFTQTFNIDTEIDHIASIELTGSAMDDFIGSGSVNVDLLQGLTMARPFCSAAGFDLDCSVDWSSRWYGDLTVTYLDEEIITSVPEPASWLMMVLGVAGIGWTRRQLR